MRTVSDDAPPSDVELRDEQMQRFGVRGEVLGAGCDLLS